MTFRYACALCCAAPGRRYCRANSSDRPFISITLLECNSAYVPSISRRVNLFSHRDNITFEHRLARSSRALCHGKNLIAGRQPRKSRKPPRRQINVDYVCLEKKKNDTGYARRNYMNKLKSLSSCTFLDFSKYVPW